MTAAAATAERRKTKLDVAKEVLLGMLDKLEPEDSGEGGGGRGRGRAGGVSGWSSLHCVLQLP